MIEVKGLRKAYQGQTVLKDIDLTVAAGEVVAVIGPSGSGKTTLLRCLNLLETPEAGVIRIGDVQIDASRPLRPQQQAIRTVRQRAGFVFQNFNLFPHRTALDNVIEGPVIVQGEARDAAVMRGRELLSEVGLADKTHAYPAQLSGGQQQRVAIARALAMRPQVILFDEPTSALDPERVSEVLETIRSLAEEGRTLVIVTHEMAFARDVAHRVLFMDDGLIVEQGSAAELLTNPREERTQRFLAKFAHYPATPSLPPHNPADSPG